jgi:hypothetical protein
MSVTRAAAAAALHDIEAASARSATLRGYQSAAPHLVIWGVAWAIAYAVNDLAPPWGNATWLMVWPVAVTGDIVATRRDRGRQSAAAGRTMLTLFAIFMVLVGGTIAIMAPGDSRQIGAFIPLVVAAGYAIMGVLGLARLLVLGAALAALTLLGYFGLPSHFLLWMAVVGGGGLILGGIWLRQA